MSDIRHSYMSANKHKPVDAYSM